MHRIPPLLLICMLFPCVAVAAQPRVEMEILTGQGVTPIDSRQWYQMLVSLGVDGLRIRPGRAGEKPEVVRLGQGQAASYKVIAALDQRGRLVVEGKSFTTGDRAALKQYLDDLREHGLPQERPAIIAFGLVEEQLVAVAKDLEQTVEFSTQGQPPFELARKLRGELQWELTADAEAARRLQAAEPCRDELQGLSIGTALAAMARPVGLVLQPDKDEQGRLRHVLRSSAEGKVWPIGFEPERRLRQVAPILFEFITVEIDGVSVHEAIAALQERMKLPVLWDYNQMARHGVDPTKVPVSIPADRLYYKRIVDRTLFAARLKGEVRIDDAGKPFLWITTIKQ